MMSEYHVAVSTNLRYLPGAKTAVCSVAANARQESQLVFHVFTEGVPKSALSTMEGFVEKIHARSVIVQHEVDDGILSGLPFWASSRMAAVRCKYAELLPEVDWCLYLDCDVLYLASIEEHFAEIDDKYAVIATQEQHTPTRKRECDWIRANGFAGIEEEKYFNSGVMLLNLRKMRNENLSEKLIDFFRVHEDVSSPDQDALNSVLIGTVKIVSPKWNSLQIFLTNDTIKEMPVIHYVSGIPWLPICSVVANGRYRLWHAFNDMVLYSGVKQSESSLIPFSIRIVKRIEYMFLSSRSLGAIFRFLLRMIGKGKFFDAWREIQIGCDIDAQSIERVLGIVRTRMGQKNAVYSVEKSSKGSCHDN